MRVVLYDTALRDSQQSLVLAAAMLTPVRRQQCFSWRSHRLPVARQSFLPWMQAFEAALEQDPKNAEVASRLGKCLVVVHEYR